MVLEIQCISRAGVHISKQMETIVQNITLNDAHNSRGRSKILGDRWEFFHMMVPPHLGECVVCLSAVQ